MDINDTLFKSLLLQNNITEFRKFRIDPKSIGNSKLDNSIKIDYKYFNIDNIYAYIKNDIFHICNEKFEEIKLSNIYFAEKGLHLIGYNDEQFFYPYLNQEHSLVISSGGDIICRDPKDFFYVGTNEFLENPPIFLNDYEEGLLYDFLKRQFINPITYDGWEGYKRNFNVPVPKIETINPIVNGKKDENLLYLFSINKTYISPPHITSFFINNANNSIFFIESSKYGTDKRDLEPVCLWYSNGHVYAISLNILNKFDSEGNIIYPESSYSHRVSFEVKVNSGSRFDCRSTAILDFYGSMENKWDLEYFYKNLQFIPTKNSLLILFSDDYRNSHHTIIINEKGEFTLCEHLECSSVALTENNILRLGTYDNNTIDYCDINGTCLCSANRHNPKFQVFTRNFREPVTFNPEETEAKNKEDHTRYYKDGVISQLEGVINLQNGNIIIPPCYSKVEIREIYYDYETSLNNPMYVSIVQINNYLKGIKSSYYGIYLNDKLVTPIGYSNIKYLKYKLPKEEVCNSYELEDDKYFKEYDSNFILLEKNGLFGIASKFGTPIIEPCANSYKILEEIKRIPIKNEPGKTFIRHIPNREPEYIALFKDDLYNLIYRDNIISDFVINNFELISLDDYREELFFVKVLIGSKESIIYNGKFITDNYSKIKIFLSEYGNSNDSMSKDFVILVFDDSGKAALLNSKSEIIINFGSYNIIPYLNYIIMDSKILDKNNNIVFDASNYTLIDEKHGYRNEHILCYHSNDNPLVYIIIDSDCKIHKINIEEDFAPEFYVGLKSYYFDTNLLVFNEVLEQEENDEGDNYDYEDDYDYERDTYYALGGDDYDSFRENGGSIDDMMDGMGF